MKLTITTLVIVEGSYIQGIFHSLEEHPGKAYQELVDQVENEYGYDADKDHVPLHFKTIQDIKDYFEHIETQELTANGFKTAILKEDGTNHNNKRIPNRMGMARQIPLEQNKEVQTKIKEIIYNNLYDTIIDELKGTISRFQAQYNIQEINPYLQDILQNPDPSPNTTKDK